MLARNGLCACSKDKMREIKSLIDRSVKAIDSRDALALRKISADTLSEAALEGHRELILLALVDYALSKIMSKVHYSDLENKFYDQIIKHLQDAREADKETMIAKLEAVENLVIKLDEKEGHFVENLIDHARVKKAAKLYEQGLSLKRASDLTGADSAHVLDYIGASKIHEFEGGGKNATRLKAARQVFD